MYNVCGEACFNQRNVYTLNWLSSKENVLGGAISKKGPAESLLQTWKNPLLIFLGKSATVNSVFDCQFLRQNSPYLWNDPHVYIFIYIYIPSIYQPFCTGWMRNKVNFWLFNRFEFRVFLLLDWLLYQGLRTLSALLLFTHSWRENNWIWTHVIMFISYGDNHCTMGTSNIYI